MNLLDLIIVVLIVMGMMTGYQRGFVLQITTVLGYLVSLVVAFRFAPEGAEFLQDISPWSSQPSNEALFATFNTDMILYLIVSFFLLFLLTRFVFNLIARFINGIFKLPGLNIVNKLLGGALGIVKILLVSFIAVHILLYIPWETGQEWVQTSQIAAWLFDMSPLSSMHMVMHTV